MSRLETGAVVEAEDTADLLKREELAAVRAARAGLLRVLEEEEDVLPEGFARRRRGQRGHDRHVPVVPAAVVRSAVGARDRVHVGPERHALPVVLAVGGVKPLPAVVDLQIALLF